MYEYFVALILSIVEGITEFLPISSTGHLIIVNEWLDFSDPQFSETFNIFIQVGAIVSVLVLFWKKLWIVDKNKNWKPQSLNLWVKTIIGVIPSLIIGYLCSDIIEQKLLNTKVVSISLIVGGIIIILFESYKNPKMNNKNISLPVDQELNEKLSHFKAFFIGIFQCLAMIPGVSRSASSIFGGMSLGLSRTAAAEFSFFLALPTLTAASLYFLIKNSFQFNYHQFFILTFGFLVSFLIAYIIISYFLKYIKNHTFTFFGYYRILLGIILCIYLYFK